MLIIILLHVANIQIVVSLEKIIVSAVIMGQVELKTPQPLILFNLNFSSA